MSVVGPILPVPSPPPPPPHTPHPTCLLPLPHVFHVSSPLLCCAGTVDLVSVVGPLDNAFKGACTFEAGQ